MKKLYSVLLWGKIRKENLMEDHQLVFVVAENEKEARTLAKLKRDAEDIHVDGAQRIDVVDGYEVRLEKTNSTKDASVVNSEYSG